MTLLWRDSLRTAIGMSLRIFLRRKNASLTQLGEAQRCRTWKSTEILAKATTVFGTREEAEQWLKRPAIGLDQRRPIERLATPAGVKAVGDFLDRLKYGVYT